MIRPYDRPLKEHAGFKVAGVIFLVAILKTSVISDSFQWLSSGPEARAVHRWAMVFEGPHDYRARIEDPDLHIDAHCMLVVGVPFRG